MLDAQADYGANIPRVCIDFAQRTTLWQLIRSVYVGMRLRRWPLRVCLLQTTTNSWESEKTKCVNDTEKKTIRNVVALPCPAQGSLWKMENG